MTDRTGQKGYTVQGLADELGVELDYTQTQLKRLGMKGEIAPERSVSKSLANAIKQAHQAITESTKHQIAASKGEEGETVTDEEFASYTDKLKLSECKGIAERMGTSKAFINDANSAMQRQRLNLAAHLGAAQYQQQEAARRAGFEYAQIQDLKQQQADLLELEKQIAVMQGVNSIDQVLEDAGMGGLDDVIAAIQEEQQQDAKDRQKLQEIVGRMQEGGEPSEEELRDPFVSLAWDQIKGSGSYGAGLGAMFV